MLSFEEEVKIAPPVNPLTVKINMAILDWYFRGWAKKNLPAFEVVETSGYRAPERNAKAGGAANSAHLHGLAKDFVLKRDGKILSATDSKTVYDEFVKETWPGYSHWKHNHIHVNLSRQITIYAGMLGLTAIGVIAAKLIFAGEAKK